MREADVQRGWMFSYVSLELRDPSAHLLRCIRSLLDEALADTNRDCDQVFPREGRP